MFAPKERATFSISADVKRRLDEAVPRNKRSHFVEKAIDRALRDMARQRVRKLLDELPLARSSGESSADFLQRKREEWDARPIEFLRGREE